MRTRHSIPVRSCTSTSCGSNVICLLEFIHPQKHVSHFGVSSTLAPCPSVFCCEPKFCSEVWVVKDWGVFAGLTPVQGAWIMSKVPVGRRLGHRASLVECSDSRECSNDCAPISRERSFILQKAFPGKSSCKIIREARPWEAQSTSFTPEGVSPPFLPYAISTHTLCAQREFCVWP